MKLASIVALALLSGAAPFGAQQPRAKPGARAASVPAVEPARWVAPIPRSYLYTKMNQGELYSVEFLNYQIGFAVGGHSDSTMIFRTRDGGKNWERVGMYDGQQHVPRFTAIRFADANNGWMVGDYHVLRTTDGGETWAPAPVSDPSNGNSLSAISLLVLGPNALMLGTRGGTVHVTTDGGATWGSAKISDGYDDVVGLSFAPPNKFYAVTSAPHSSHSKGTIHRSVDGGRTWQLRESVDAGLYAIDFRGQRGVVAGMGLVLITEDGGESWRQAIAAGERESVRFIDAQMLVSTGNSPHVSLSRDGGRTWRAMPSPIVGSSGHLVDVAAPDVGWWFAAGGYGANALYHYLDPGYTAPIANGRIPLPVDVRLPDGSALPRGLYEVTLGHRGDEHVIVLDREGDVPADADVPADLKETAGQQQGQKPPTCANPCEVTIPTTVTYEKVESGSGESGEPSFGETSDGGSGGMVGGATGKSSKSFFHLRLEPTANGVAVVLQTAVTPPRRFGLALAALGAPQTSDAEIRDVGQKAAKKSGGLFDRVRKAAAGDVKGAVAGAVNPQETAQRVRAAKAAPPAVYRITLRHSLDLFGEKGAQAKGKE